MHKMVRLSQLIGKNRSTKKRKSSKNALENQPQRKSVCLKVFTMSPKKPNSANRKVARIRVGRKQLYTCAIPGEGHNLQQYSVLLVQGGKFKDLPGVRLRAIRGKYDLSSVLGRKTSRSLYGVKRIK